MIKKFDEVYLYDNSIKYKHIFSFINNKILYKDKNVNWSKDAIEIIENKKMK